MAAVLRGLLLSGALAAVLIAVVHVGNAVIEPQQLRVLLPFLAVALATTGLFLVSPSVERMVARVAGRSPMTPYSALAEAARRIQAGALDQVLPGLAQVLAEGTAAVRAVVWLAVEDRLVDAAHHPPDAADPDRPGRTLPGLADLLADPGTDHVEPVLDAGVLRAALAISKPEAITAEDRRLLRDVAHGAALLLRVVALNAELSERVRRADELAEELHASRGRLDSAREAERRRLVTELSHAMDDRLVMLRADLVEARAGLAGEPDDLTPVREALTRTRNGLDELLDRFRTVARGVYPSVLRDQGPAAALDEVAADLARPVRLRADRGPRVAWELESGLYYAAASALRELADRPAGRELTLRLEHVPGRLGVVIEDPAPPVTTERLEVLLGDDADRLIALGGGLRIAAGSEEGWAARGPRPERPPLVVRIWVPDRVEPLVERSAEVEVPVR